MLGHPFERPFLQNGNKVLGWCWSNLLRHKCFTVLKHFVGGQEVGVSCSGVTEHPVGGLVKAFCYHSPLNYLANF